jgi:hypothetical protein
MIRARMIAIQRIVFPVSLPVPLESRLMPLPMLSSGWRNKLRLENPSPETGRDIDFHKNGIAVEVQFSHYALIQSDISRMQRLHAGELVLAGNLPVRCGIEIVVDRAMPTSQGVSRADQALQRGAPIAQTLPLLIVSIQPPQVGEEVLFHTIQERRRHPVRTEKIIWPRGGRL